MWPFDDMISKFHGKVWKWHLTHGRTSEVLLLAMWAEAHRDIQVHEISRWCVLFTRLTIVVLQCQKQHAKAFLDDFLVCQSFDLGGGCCLQSMSVQLGSNRGIIFRAIETPLNAAEEDNEKEEKFSREALNNHEITGCLCCIVCASNCI